jgi:hypothetical protein
MKIRSAKISFRLPLAIYNPLREEAESEGREVGEHLQRILIDYAIDKNLIATAEGVNYGLRDNLAHRAVGVALAIHLGGGILRDHIKRTFRSCEDDADWLRDYRVYIGGGDPFQQANATKTLLNQHIGMKIRRALGATVATHNGKPVKKTVAGSIIRSFTEFVPSEGKTVGQELAACGKEAQE